MLPNVTGVVTVRLLSIVSDTCNIITLSASENKMLHMLRILPFVEPLSRDPNQLIEHGPVEVDGADSTTYFSFFSVFVVAILNCHSDNLGEVKI